LSRLLAVVEARPLEDARTVRRGRGRGGRSLIVKTLVLTGLRVNELRTLAVEQLDLTPGAEWLRLDAADEKSREGNMIPVRGDLADGLSGWLAGTSKASADPLFDVPTGFRRILDRDLKAAGIPERDDCGMTKPWKCQRMTPADNPCHQRGVVSGRRDLNPRPLAPQASCRYRLHEQIRLEF
jgi:hypothetical protein